MARLRLGRDAKVYISDAAFTAAGLVEVTRAKDITITDEAAEVTGTARDLEYDVYDVGSKSFGVEFEINDLATDPTTGSDRDLLRTAYDAGSELYVVVTRGDKTVDTGKAVKFKGKVFKYGGEYPEGDMGRVGVVLKPSDPDNPPTRVATPLA